MARRLRDLCLLTRPPISIAAAALAGFGWWQARPVVGTAFFTALAGVFLLACGASALNQVQEKERDARMLRTQNRPLPTGRMGRSAAAAIALGLLSGGFVCLYVTGGAVTVLAGLAVVVLYNGVYTPLKPVSALALPIGALAGAAPMLLGALAAGGNLGDPLLLLCFGIAVLWQIPHFWVRAARRRDEYLQAGFVVPFLHFSTDLHARTALLWLPALGAALLLPVLFLRPVNLFAGITLGLISLTLTFLPLFALRRPNGPHPAVLRAADLAVCAGLCAILSNLPTWSPL